MGYGKESEKEVTKQQGIHTNNIACRCPLKDGFYRNTRFYYKEVCK